MSLRIDVAEQGGRVAAKISGVIDEGAPLQEELSRIQKDATIDLGEVSRVNSVGLLSWIRAIKALTSQYAIEVRRVSYPMALQANQVADLFGAAQVSSCLAPYFCASCQNNEQVEVTSEEINSTPSGVPQKSCSKCSVVMEFDDLEDYFRFMKRTV